jgi:cobalamin synthase
MTLVLVKLLIRFAVFALVFWAVARKNKDIVITPRWALPLVAALFAILNAGLYWILKPIANAATFGMLAYLLPLLINGGLLWGTVFLLRRKPKPDGKGKLIERPGILAIKGVLALVLLALALTVAHGLLWFVLEFIPAKA